MHPLLPPSVAAPAAAEWVLLYVADIVVAADDARFALGYGALGLTADGGNTWFLPRMWDCGKHNNFSCSTAGWRHRKHSRLDWCRG
jgi:enoyl-CoA hydratase/carnithine racemase